MKSSKKHFFSAGIPGIPGMPGMPGAFRMSWNINEKPRLRWKVLCNKHASACGPQRSNTFLMLKTIFFVNVEVNELNFYMNFTFGLLVKDSQLQMRYLNMCKYLNIGLLFFRLLSKLDKREANWIYSV